jgi:hypothetical protein
MVITTDHVIVPEISGFVAIHRTHTDFPSVDDALHNCKAIFKASASSYPCIALLLILFSYSTSGAYRN